MPEALPPQVAEFERLVRDQGMPVLVYFHAEWCPPCRALSPVIDRIAQLYTGRAAVVKVQSEQNRELTDHYNVRSIPTLMLFGRDGLVEPRLVVRSVRELTDRIDREIAAMRGADGVAL